MATRKDQKQAEDFLKQGIDSVTKNVDSFSDFAKENLDAWMKSTNLAVKATEKLTSEAVEASKANIEKTISVAKELSNIRSADQFVTSQTQFSKQFVENCVNQFTKFGDIFISATKEVSEPLNSRVSAFSEQFVNKKAS